MKKTALILAVIASAIAALLTAPAQAGGKRLQFGGPLGSFVATPYAKGSSGHSSRRSSHTSRKAHARKLAAKRAAAKKAHARKLAAKKAAAKQAHAKQLAARKAAAKQAHARKLAAKKAAAKKAAARQLAAKKAAARKIAARKAAAATKKRELTESRNAEEAKDVVETASNSDDSKLAPVKASAIAGTNTLKFDRDEKDLGDDVDTELETADVEEDTAEETQDEIRETKAELECKKYIPSAGLTITVPCGS